MPVRGPDKTDRASVWRKGWAYVIGRILRQSHIVRRTNLLDVNIVVVLFFPIPRKGYLIPVRRKARRTLKTWVGGERNHFGRARRFSSCPAKHPRRNDYRADN